MGEGLVRDTDWPRVPGVWCTSLMSLYTGSQMEKQA